MKYIFTFFTAFLVYTQIPFAQDDNEISFNSTLHLFQKFESRMDSVRNKNRRDNVFMDPLDRASIFEDNIKLSPELFDKTNLYSKYLVQILLDQGLKKGREYNSDIVRTLYHLCIDDYVVAIDSIYKGYIENKVDLGVLLECVRTTDHSYSNIVVLNYKFQKLRIILEKMLANHRLIERADKLKNIQFSREIKLILNGDAYFASKNLDPDKYMIYVIPLRNCDKN